MSVDADRQPWAPTASIEALTFRARKKAIVRRFFDERGVLEVDTPVLGRGGSTDPHLDPLSCDVLTAEGIERFWLQTSPEGHMKRLLAAGSGPIYQIAHAFRDGERGRRHNVEFSMLEWYRPGYDLPLLMAETVELIEAVVAQPVTLRVRSYRQLFREYLALDPFQAPLETLQAQIAVHAAVNTPQAWERASCLDLLMSHVIEPQLGHTARPDRLLLDAVTDYPAEQAALARRRTDPEDGVDVAARFELYWQGVELANGYDELTDVAEQILRFALDAQARQRLGKPEVRADEALIGALSHGMPAGSGVALGLDRLIMLAFGSTNLAEVVAFPLEHA